MFIEEQINEFNYDATGYRDGREPAAIVRDEEGAIIAGLTGFTWAAAAR